MRSFDHLNCPFTEEQLMGMAKSSNSTVEIVFEGWVNYSVEAIVKRHSVAKEKGMSFVDYTKMIEKEHREFFDSFNKGA